MSGALQDRAITPFGFGAVSSPKPNRIAVFQALSLGDLLCATPALRALRRRFTGAEIIFIGRSWAREFVERLPAVDRFIPFPGFPGIAESPPDAGERASIWPPFDLAVQMHGSGSGSNGFVASLAAAQSLGFGLPGEKRLSTRLDWIEDEPEPIRWLRLVGALGATADGLQLDFPVTAEERRIAAGLIGPADGRPVIGLHVGASDRDRRWPVEGFVALADTLVTRLGARIILTGAGPERPLTASVQQAMVGPSLDLAGLTTLGEFAAVVATLNLFVTNDTGASHVAAATRTPSVILFGPSRPNRWAPLDLIRHHIVDARAGSRLAGDGAAALQALSPELVAAHCRAALREAQLVAVPEPVRERIA